jgi:hypothetical protein
MGVPLFLKDCGAKSRLNREALPFFVLRFENLRGELPSWHARVQLGGAETIETAVNPIFPVADSLRAQGAREP